MARKKTPPEYGESPGPMIVACQWNCKYHLLVFLFLRVAGVETADKALVVS